MWSKQLEIIAEIATKKLAENGQKFSYAKAEALIGVSKNKWVAWKGGQRPSAEDLAKISKILNISAHWLLFGEGSISNDPRELEENPELTCFADTIHEVLFERLSTTPENFAEIGGISVDELTAIMQRKIQPSAMTLRNWCVRYRVNMNYIIAQMGYPLLTRAQYEQDGPLMSVRKRDKEDEYPRGCGNPPFAREAENLDSDLYDGEPYEHDRHKKPLPEVTENMLCPGQELKLIGIAQCGPMGWSLTMPLAATSSVPTFHKDMIAALAIGDSMVPAGINPGNIVYCDPRLEPLKNEPIFVIRRGRDADKEGDATIKLFVKQDDEWLYMKGWLQKNGEPHQRDFEIKQHLDEVEVVAPVVMIRRRV
ncbi:S24 family peptidase [Maridesulfovibrio ferrireducens]|uniref:S24 family peptidase n=1 Tax=Maridesulfovibrio ferrireducens TaxID=246191 RepID=UPI001A230731|nr:S24 family peptidase [Maridesulfovibrio ferrireducens]MBI9112229.1 LexA family transcriptional regulator [Maridesulfovibrio ferrireducens]